MTLLGLAITMGEAIQEDLISVQDRVRAAFNWTYDADVKSADLLRMTCNEHPQAEAFGWSSRKRQETLEELRTRLLQAEVVVLVGADASRDQLNRDWPVGAEFVAADGAVGACLEQVIPCCVVTDLDGGEHLEAAVKKGIPLVMHAHGDNVETWRASLERWEATPPPLVLTHQTHQRYEDMFNPGGFTDGDRAVCFLHWLGVSLERVRLIGYSTHRVGSWSGRTNPARKLEKLGWMATVLDTVHPSWRASQHEDLP